MRKIVLFLIAVVSVTSCYYDNTEELNGGAQEPCDVGVVTYSEDVSVIMNKSCAYVGCHLKTPTVAAAAGLDFSTYGSVSAKATEIRTEINLPSGVGMPSAGRLPQCDIDKINAWIDMGAIEN